MPHFNTAAVGALTAALLAGCGSTSSTTTPPPMPGPDYTSFAEIATDANPLLAEYVGDPAAAAADIPDSSSATYDGFISIPLADGELIGQLEMVVTFAALNGTVASTADGFFHENNGAYTGEISGVGTLSKSLVAGQPQVVSTLNGTLANGGIDYQTEVSLAGDITSDGVDPAGAMVGFADTTLVWNGGANFETSLTGVFAAEQ